MLTEIRLTNTSLTLGSVGKGGGELDFSARALPLQVYKFLIRFLIVLVTHALIAF